MRYLIAIPAMLACIFYVYALVQFIRDEKQHRQRENPETSFERRSGNLTSFRAEKASARSFAQWSRLANQRARPGRTEPGCKTRKQDHPAQKQSSIAYVEVALPLSSAVAPIANENSEERIRTAPKKIA